MTELCCGCGEVLTNESSLLFSPEKVYVVYGCKSRHDNTYYSFFKGYRWFQKNPEDRPGRRYLDYLSENEVKEKYPGDGVCDLCTERMVEEGCLRYDEDRDTEFCPSDGVSCDCCGYIDHSGHRSRGGRTLPFFPSDRRLLRNPRDQKDQAEQWDDIITTNCICAVFRERSPDVLIHFTAAPPKSLLDYRTMYIEKLYWKYGLASSKELSHDMLVCYSCVTELIEKGFVVSKTEIEENFPRRTFCLQGYYQNLLESPVPSMKADKARHVQQIAEIEREIRFLERRKDLHREIRTLRKDD